MAKVANNDVKANKCTRMTDMTVIVNGDTTHIHVDFTIDHRFKLFFLSRECVVYLYHLVGVLHYYQENVCYHLKSMGSSALLILAN